MVRKLDRLGFKTLVILMGVASVFIALSYAVLNHVVLPAFEEIEERQSEDNLERVRHAIASELSYLGATTSDWAFWDHTYEFVRGERDSYETENLSDSTFRTLKLDFIYFYDAGGRRHWGKALDHDNTEIALTGFEGDRLPLDHPLLQGGSDPAGRSGVLLNERGAYLVATKPMIGSEQDRPSAGFLIFGRALDQEALASLREQTRVNFALWPIGHEPEMHEEVLHKLRRTPEPGIVTQVAPTSDADMWSFGTVPDLQGWPALLLRAGMPRTISEAGLRVVEFSMLLMVVAAALDIAVVGLLLHRMILRPIHKLKQHIVSSTPGEVTEPLGWDRRDEIGVLAESFDRLQHDVGEHGKVMLGAMEQVVAAGQAKAGFLASMSHELRTPLNAIIGFSDIMVRETFGPMPNKRYREYVDDIHTSGEHLLDLVNKVLDMSKLDSGRLELSDEEIDIAEIAAVAVRMITPQAAKAEIDVERRLAPQLPALLGDRLRITEILLNLLSNAVKFTDPGGRVTVTAWCTPQGELVLQVEDTGVGMAAGDIPRALSQFVQLDNNRGRYLAGTGLGLPLAKKMTEMHDGHLTITSRPGRGTTVGLRFPPSRVLHQKLTA